MEDRRISAKSRAEQLGISLERVGSIIHEDLDMRKLPAKWVPKCLNANQKRQQCQSSEQLLEFFRRDPNDFLSWLVAIDETWLYHYDPETKQQSVEWRHSDSPCPQKIPSAKMRWKSSRLDLLLSRRHPPQFLSSKGPNYQHGVLLISAGAIEGHFEGNSPWAGHQVGLVLARQCPGSPGACNTEETGPPRLPISWLPTLFSGSGPVGLPLVPWTEKNNWKFANFRLTRRSLLPRRPGLTTKFWIFLSGLQKLEQRTKKCIELHGEYVE